MNSKDISFHDWDEVWAKRAESYNFANQKYPHARKSERDIFIDSLDLFNQAVVLEVGAAGGYLSSGIYELLHGKVRILAVESSNSHIGALPAYVERVNASTITSFSLEDSSVDRVVNLASLHHTEDDTGFFDESWRVLKPGGLIGVADVLLGSPVDQWLNEFVHAHNSSGHVGKFYREGDFLRKLHQSRFADTREILASYTWNFKTKDGMCEYCRLLFGLDRISTNEQLLEALERILGIVSHPDGTVGFRWALLHAFGRKL